MDTNVIIALITLAGAIAAAIASSGIVSYVQNKGKTTVETKQIEENIISKIRREGDKKNDVLVARAELQEYKFDILLEEHLALIDKVKLTCGSADQVELAELRASALKIKYTDRIPGREPPPQFPHPGDESHS
ncbi:hypothetical protein PBI_SUZY_33 [Gordonia phage Suzy]|uniref:Uncharacterized protein n=1 Tax=Gordonia phage Suzy TaxID=2201430 RepID=A0A2Z4Q9J9_9CAUD|nr:membrane protein [Gordonia phage Suzy]AWY06138.1 hypothetical protein PBI_SUZY_33 [Gordonia phage Suzy]